MITEVIPKAYDFFGTKIGKPAGRRLRVFHPTFPMGRYLSQPLSNKFSNLDELRKFLSTCKYVSDQEQFGKDEYWLPPEEFEKSKKGDCEDFALYTWRQLIAMGIKSRFVAGQAGKYGYGHAWVTMQLDGRCFIVDPLSRIFKKMPRLSMVRYKPKISVELNEGKLSYFSHEIINYNPSIIEASGLFKEWLWFWSFRWIYIGFLLVLLPFRLERRKIGHNKRRQERPDCRRP